MSLYDLIWNVPAMPVLAVARSEVAMETSPAMQGLGWMVAGAVVAITAACVVAWVSAWMARDRWPGPDGHRFCLRGQDAQLARLTGEAFDVTGEAILVADPRGEHCAQNRAFTEMSGYDSKTLKEIGGPAEVFTAPRRFRELFARVLEAGSATRQMELVHRAGRTVPVVVRMSAVHDEQQQIIGILGVCSQVTQLRQVQAEQQKFVALVEHCQDFIVMGSRDGRVLYLNPAGRRLVGLEGLAQVTCWRIGDFYPDETRRQVTDHAWPAAVHGRHWEGQGQLKHFRSSEMIDVHITSLPLPQMDGKGGTCVALIQRDIREHVRTEESLRSAQLFLDDTLNALAAHLAILDAEGIVVGVNRAWRKFAAANGYRGSDLGVGRNYLQVARQASGLGAEGASATADGIERVLRGQQKDFSYEYPCHGPNVHRWFALQASGFEHASLRWVVIEHADITTRKQAELALFERNQALSIQNAFSRIIQTSCNLDELLTRCLAETLALASGDRAYRGGVYLWDPDNGGLRIARLQGDFNGGFDTSRGWLASTSKAFGRLARITDVAVGTNCELGLCKDGQESACRERGHYIMPLTASGEWVGVIFLCTEARPTCDNGRVDLLRSLAAQLGSAIQRFRHREDLEHAKEVAESATRAKSQFLANMSHEIRTPMTAILGFSERLLDNEVPQDERLEAAERIQRNGQHLLSLINDILDVSRIEAGRLEIQCVPVSPVDLALEVQSLMEVRATDRHMGVRVEFEGLIPATIQTDPLRLRQILVNLLGNAIKFSQRGIIRLVVGLCRHEEEPPRICFDVIDRGIGMSADQARSVFDAFNQADTSFTRQFGGTGLGLHISQKLAQMLGGDVAIVHTQPGEGTHMRASVGTGALEGIQMVDPCDALPVRPRPRSVSSAGDLRLSGRLLLAEDGEDNQDFLAAVLTRAGACVDVVDDGQAAMERALGSVHHRRAGDPAEPYDLVLMDMQMPVMDGYEATRRLREAGYDTPIVALTAHAMASDRQRCLDAGCDDYATKPIQREDLIALAYRYLSSSEEAVSNSDQDEALSVEEEGRPSCPAGLPVSEPDEAAAEGPVYSTRADDPDLTDLIRRFVGRMGKRIDTISDALDREDREALMAALHKLKGAAGSYGFTPVSEAAAAVHARVRDDEPIADLRDAVVGVMQLCGRLRAKEDLAVPEPAEVC